MDTDAIRHIDDPLYEILRNENMKAFNEAKAKRDSLPSFSHGDFRGLDLRGLDASGLDFSHAYFRGADIRGVDFREAQLEGASIAGAKISGCYFPLALHADEIVMSLNHGTRMRCNTGK
ncbi:MULTISPECIES: pentapeptide repeat-containing protein [Marinobacter]|uniref:pentapeptide repeat-containing protein n=1 Tax=Marinobacter TaxID=2742 RepID=UPI001D084275|nr:MULTISPECIES: pentapeptide repeat-containing protein [Marinobacter]MCK7568736.1 pentapeptide repeat-containing protein [Marinobacter xestospongiae]UDL04595.1 pentapeptide repeat-containing protein [Marinobacter sp. CA1]